MTQILSSILVGILTTIGWKKLVIAVGVDCLHYAAKKLDNELAKSILNDLANAFENPEKTVAPAPPPAAP